MREKNAQPPPSEPLGTEVEDVDAVDPEQVNFDGLRVFPQELEEAPNSGMVAPNSSSMIPDRSPAVPPAAHHA